MSLNMSDETPQERQDNEFEVLKSIFADDIVDNRETIAWKVWRPLDLLITLHPLHSSSVAGRHCSVTLHIKCCPNYPDRPPDISIHKLFGLSNENGAKLLEELKSMSVKLCGEVMIFELAQHAQSFLLEFNKPTLSFYDEMLERKNEMERLKQRDIEIKENEERQKMKHEIERRQQMLLAGGRQRQRHTSLSPPDEEPPGDAPQLVFYADTRQPPSKKTTKEASVHCTCNTKGIQIVRFSHRNNRKVHIGKCLGHSPNGSTTYLGIDGETGDLVATKKWLLHPATDFQTRNKQLNLIEQDLKTMYRLKNPHLVPYTALETQQESVRKSVFHCIYIVREFVLGCSLKHLRANQRFADAHEALRWMRHLAFALFSALRELHRVDIVHRDVRSEHVFVSEGGAVRLAGVALDVRLADIHDGENCCEKQTKAQDILAAAQLLLSVVSNENTATEIPSHLPTSAKDFFSRCLSEDEGQWSAQQLMSHPFLREAPAAEPEPRSRDDGYDGSEEEEHILARSLGASLLGSGESRLNAEFDTLKWLGKGAFGDVLKVKNKLDGRFYAIKRIKLNPENVELNKKITREVKLLSRLNHEHVVRYHNAWIESLTTGDEDVSSSTDSYGKTAANTPEQKSSPAKRGPANSMEAVLAKLAPWVKLEWSISEAPAPTQSDSESEDEEEDGWFKIPATDTLDDTGSSIEFEVNENKSRTLSSEITPEDSEEARPPTVHIQKVLFIQMEFCEKNTLRQAIDNGLYLEHFRAWKLFREIVEGLAHVHQRGMIHRDLKPVNIFLDLNDHVKIGDFGLATKLDFSTVTGLDDKTKHQEDYGGSLTGQIGTALYVAPELLQAANKVIYNQKVDLYSLGIILFEMFHPPLSTGMERMKVLTDLRTRNIEMPASFVTEENAKQIEVIRWLLSHDASSRPTCAELLASGAVPRAVAEGALSGLVAHTLSARRSRHYRRLVAACLDQPRDPAEDVTFHSGLRVKGSAVLAAVCRAVVEVFKLHGALEFTPPLLTPRARGWEQRPNAVRVMTAAGTVCHLPHDLRLPFARHVAYTGTRAARRYAVGRVYRERHVDGFHPREMLECAFDIVTPERGSLWSDAEVLAAAGAAAAAAHLRPAVAVNHTAILRAVLRGCGVAGERHSELYPILADMRLGRITSMQLQTHLTSLCISSNDINALSSLIETNVPVSELREAAASWPVRAECARSLAEAISDIEAACGNARALGLDCPVTVAPCLAYNASQHSGVFWQMCAGGAAGGGAGGRRRAGNLVAAGGRYDSLLSEFAEGVAGAGGGAGAAGLSMSLERIAAIVKKMEVDLPGAAGPSQLCVAAGGAAADGRAARRARLTHELRRAGYAVCACECTSASEAHELSGAAVVLLDDGDGVCAVCWDDNRVREYRMPFADVLDFVRQRLSPDCSRSFDAGTVARSSSYSETERAAERAGASVAVTFVTAADRVGRPPRRQTEGQINAQVTSALARLGVARARVLVLALACEAACVRALAAHADTPLRRDALARAVERLAESFPRRRGMLEEAVEELISMASGASGPRQEEPTLFALYSIPDSVLRLLT